MVIERWRRIESLFHAARSRAGEERSLFLSEACGADEALRREVESLLASEDLAGEFLESDAQTGPPPAVHEPVRRGACIGPYIIGTLLGAGGMGRVYQAHDKRLDRDVAIKFLPIEVSGDPIVRKRFEQEARAASALNHPNICTIHDIGEHEGRIFLVMELLEGQSLKDRIAGRAVPAADLLAISRQVCAGLQAAHAKGVVHRDVKPANIFLTQGGQVKIVDFGLAKRGTESLRLPGSPLPLDESTRTASLTVFGTIMGTLAYMSPEQAVGEEVDARSDIFSFGVVLYEMATGQLPFHGRTPAGLLGSILTEAPEKPSAINPAVPIRLDRVILKAIEKDREVRYQSIALLSAGLMECSQLVAEIGARRTRRWMLAAGGTAAAALTGGGFLARRSLFPPSRRVRIAVLPFENIGGDPREAFFADGIHQEMISMMNRLYPDRVAVIARTSVKHYQAKGASIEQVGRELNADYVVEGGVQRDQGKARVVARLVRAANQTSIWDSSYDRDLSQVLAVQSEIAHAIAQGVARGLEPDSQVSASLSRPLNAAAHEAYLRGDYAKAVQLDPGYAAAYTGMASRMYYPGLFGLRPPRKAFAEMGSAAAKALALDATQAEAHASLALSKLHLELAWPEAEEGFRRASRLDPANGEVRHFFGHYLLWSGRGEKSAEECRRGLEVDPYNPSLISCIGWHELCSGHIGKALEETRRALRFDPNHGWAMFTLGLIYEQKGMFKEALAALRNAFDFPLKKASLAHAFASSGDRRTAGNILNELQEMSKRRYISPYDIAVVHAGLEDADRAFEWLNRAYEENAGFLLFVRSDPRFLKLRADRRFRDLLGRMRYPQRQA